MSFPGLCGIAAWNVRYHPDAGCRSAGRAVFEDALQHVDELGTGVFEDRRTFASIVDRGQESFEHLVRTTFNTFLGATRRIDSTVKTVHRLTPWVGTFVASEARWVYWVSP